MSIGPERDSECIINSYMVVTKFQVGRVPVNRLEDSRLTVSLVSIERVRAKECLEGTYMVFNAGRVE